MLVLLVPAMLTSVSLSSLILLCGGSIDLHRNWVNASAVLFVGSCYYLSSNDIHSACDRDKGVIDHVQSLINMPDVDFGSGLELLTLICVVIALAYCQLDNKATAIATLGVTVAYAAKISNKIKRVAKARRRQRIG